MGAVPSETLAMYSSVAASSGLDSALRYRGSFSF